MHVQVDVFRPYIIIGTEALSHVFTLKNEVKSVAAKLHYDTRTDHGEDHVKYVFLMPPVPKPKRQTTMTQVRGVSGGWRRSRGRRAKDAAWHGWRCSQQSGSDRTQRSSTVGDAAGGARREWTKKAWGQESIYILQMIGVREVVESYAKKNLRE
jgi:hypothetical protein